MGLDVPLKVCGVGEEQRGIQAHHHHTRGCAGLRVLVNIPARAGSTSAVQADAESLYQYSVVVCSGSHGCIAVGVTQMKWSPVGEA
jgi:hypothetical protein